MTDWESFTGEPLAPFVGPFPRAPFLESWRRHRPAGDLTIVGDAFARAAVVVSDGVARYAGEEHLTDYHSPLGPRPAALVDPLLGLGVPLVLDSLPAEAADPLEGAFVEAGAAVTRTLGEPCMVLDLSIPGDDGWEAMLESKQRHEVRRKRRRFTEAMGEPVIAEDHGAFGHFVDLHRAADGAKGGFMTDPMAAFFGSLLGLDCARLDVLRADGRVIAAAFGFEDDDAYYLYNSAFDPPASAVSPGIVLVDGLVQTVAASGRSRFDFLKGNEVYKRRLGAVERPLFTLEVAP